MTGAHAYLVGGGIASLAAAVFLIRDGGFAGGDVHVLEQLPVVGGSMDGAGDSDTGYVTRGGRMLSDEAYTCLWDLLESIPTLTDPALSVRDEIRSFNEQWPTVATARMVDGRHDIVDAATFGLSVRDCAELAWLLMLPESAIGSRGIEDFFSAHFFHTNFWCMWRTTFAFQNWHSAVELRRYLLRFIQEFPRLHTLAGVRRTRLNQYDSVIRPIRAWLAERGVVFEHGVEVTDIDFATDGGARRVTRIHHRDGCYELGPADLAFVTLGSMTADSAQGDDEHAPELVRDKRDGSWRLWEALARKADDFGRPDRFCGNVEESKWESFTLTMRDPALVRRIQEWSGARPGTGALMTFRDSPWLMSVVVPHPPHFEGQPDDVHTLWGYGLFPDRPGHYVDATMASATGRQILTELLGQLGWPEMGDTLAATTTVIPVMMPYITSQFARRSVGDRPKVVPDGAANFAFLGQFVEIPDDVVFTVEYSVRGAMQAVRALLAIDKPIPPVYQGLHDPQVALSALRTAFASMRHEPAPS